MTSDKSLDNVGIEFSIAMSTYLQTLTPAQRQQFYIYAFSSICTKCFMDIDWCKCGDTKVTK